MPLRIGIDLGGTKIEIAALDDAGVTLLRQRAPTPAGNYERTIATIVELFRDAESRLEPASSIGIGTPGSTSHATGLIRNANSTVLNGKPLERDLVAALGRPIRMTNDANCFILSEATNGAAAGAQVAFGVILGTGVGGGIAVHGRVVEGVNAIAGEWGHNPLPWPRDDERPGPQCYCGKHGCIETFLSGPGLEAQYERQNGVRISSSEIAALAASGDEKADAALALYEDRLSRALAGVINILDPEAIVLGGGVSNIERLYANVARLLPRYVFSDRVDTRLLRAIHGDSSGVLGAAIFGAT